MLSLIAVSVWQTPNVAWAAMAKVVTIRRDRYGVPHIEGPTDESVVFGLMVAQAEDNFAQLERDTIYAIGRAAEIDGERGLGNDVRVRAFEVPRLAQQTLARASAKDRKVAQAYADGLNYFLQTHPNVRPALLTRFEPWYFIANIDLPGSIDGISTGRGARQPEPVDPGSNAWAIAPSRTESHRAVLFSNPHVGLFGRGQRYECHLSSREGWNFSGFAILGNPVPHAGHNARLGWSHTNTGADSADAYREEVSGQEGSHRFRVGDQTRAVQQWTEVLRVRVGNQTEARPIVFRATSRGPLVTFNDAWYSLRFPVEQGLRWWRQRLAMGHARNLREFKKALDMTALVGSNTTYADADGHIAFWYANAVPRRSRRFDWKKPVDGTDPATEWDGFLSPRLLPNTIDPPSGFVQNCNSDPWHTTLVGNPVRDRFPGYIANDIDTARAQNSRRILGDSNRFSWPELTRLAFDTYVYTATTRVPMLLQEADRQSTLSQRTKEALNALRTWDYRCSVHSIPSTLYFETEMDLLSQGIGWRRSLEGTPSEMLAAFERTVARLDQEFSTWQVPWGRVNRMQRTESGRNFSDERPSLPVNGAPSVFGQIFAFGYPLRAGGVHYGTEGNTYVSLVEFGPRVQALSVCGFGQSADSTSPHFLDQAPLYAAGRFKPAWFTEEEVRANTERSYHP